MTPEAKGDETLDAAGPPPRLLEVAEAPPRFELRTIALLLGSVLAVVLAVAVSNVLVDPLYRWHTKLISPYPTEPGVKEHAIAEGVDAQVVVIGDSRGLGVDPVRLGSLSGRRAYNAATSSSLLDDQVDLADRVLRQARPGPHAVVWVVAPESFRDGPGWGEDLRLTISLGELKRTLQRIGMSFGVHTPDLLYRYDGETGGQRQARPAVGFFDRGAARARRLLRTELESYITDDRRRDLDRPARRQAIVSAVRRWRSQGVEVALVIPPWHPMSYEVTDGKLQRLMDVFLPNMRADAQKAGARLVDASRISAFGGDEHEFLDGVHMRPSNLRRFSDLIARKALGAL